MLISNIKKAKKKKWIYYTNACNICLHLFICKLRNLLNQNCKVLTSYPTKCKSIKVIDGSFLLIAGISSVSARTEKRYYVSVFSESTLLRSICKFRDTTEGYEVIFERVPGKVWNSDEESNFPIHLIGSITARRKVISSSVTFQLAQYASRLPLNLFVRIFSGCEKLYPVIRDWRRHIRHGLRMAMNYIIK